MRLDGEVRVVDGEDTDDARVEAPAHQGPGQTGADDQNPDGENFSSHRNGLTDESEVNGSGRISKTDLLEVSDEPTEAAEGGKESDEDNDEHDPERDLEDVGEGGQRDVVSRPLHVEPVVHKVEAHRQVGHLPHGGMKFNAGRRGSFMATAPNRLSRTLSKYGS